MAKAKKIKVVEEEVVEGPQQEEEFVNNTNITVHHDRWDSGTNTNVSQPLPSLDD